MDRITQIKNYIQKAFIKILLNQRLTLEEKEKKLYFEDRDDDTIIFNTAKEIEELIEEWMIQDQESVNEPDELEVQKNIKIN